jgi:hypothetical protein
MDYKKTMLYVSGLLLAAGGPITVYSGAELLNSKKDPNAIPAATVAAEPNTSRTVYTAAIENTSKYFTSRSRATSPYGTVPAMPSLTLDEALRFDVTVEWVIQHWPHVTTGLSYLQLQGYRVTLMTGASLPDVAGSLTYYFNAQQQVQRITLTGTTGDPSRLATVVGSRYHFARRLVNEPGIVLYEAVDWSNRPVGVLKIRSAKVILASQPYSRYEVDLLVDRTEMGEIGD